VEIKVDAGSKVFSRPMLPALIVLALEPRQREARYDAHFCDEVIGRKVIGGRPKDPLTNSLANGKNKK